MRRLPVEGSDLEGIHYLRALRNADALRDDVADAERVVLVGGSYIGTEVAASLTGWASAARSSMQEDVTLEARLRRARGALRSRACSTSTAWRSTAASELARLEGAGRARRARRLRERAGARRPTPSCSARARSPT